jgi:hypothetical protein
LVGWVIASGFKGNTKEIHNTFIDFVGTIFAVLHSNAFLGPTLEQNA